MFGAVTIWDLAKKIRACRPARARRRHPRGRPVARRQDPGHRELRPAHQALGPRPGSSSARSRITPTRSTPWRSPPTARRSPRPGPTAPSSSGTSPPASGWAPSRTRPPSSTPSPSAPGGRPSWPGASTARSGPGRRGPNAPLVRSVFAPRRRRPAAGRLPRRQDPVSSGEDKAVKVWDLADPEAPGRDPRPGPTGRMAVAISPDGSRIAVGRYDGSLHLRRRDRPGWPRPARAPGAAKPAPPAKPELARNASLNPAEPRGGRSRLEPPLTLTGNGVGEATAVVFDEPGLAATIVPAEKPDRQSARRRPGHRPRRPRRPASVRGLDPAGRPAGAAFAVSADAEAAEAEPNDDPARPRPSRCRRPSSARSTSPGTSTTSASRRRRGDDLVFEAWRQGAGLGARGVPDPARRAGARSSPRPTPPRGARPGPGVHGPARRDADASGVADAEYGGIGQPLLPHPGGEDSGAGRPPSRSASSRARRRRSPWPDGTWAGSRASRSPPPAGAEAGTMIEVPVALPDGRRPDRSPGRSSWPKGRRPSRPRGTTSRRRAEPVAAPGGDLGDGSGRDGRRRPLPLRGQEGRAAHRRGLRPPARDADRPGRSRSSTPGGGPSPRRAPAGGPDRGRLPRPRLDQARDPPDAVEQPGRSTTPS